MNNGTIHYDHDRDGTHSELDGCTVSILKKYLNFVSYIYICKHVYMIQTNVITKRKTKEVQEESGWRWRRRKNDVERGRCSNEADRSIIEQWFSIRTHLSHLWYT